MTHQPGPSLSGASAPLNRSTAPRVLPFLAFMALLALRGWIADAPQAWGLPDSRWLYLVQALLPLALLLAWRSSYSELRLAPKRLSHLMLSLAVGVAVFLLWIAPLPGWAQLGKPAAAFEPVTSAGALRWDLIGVRALGAALVVPIMEELFWRSFLMRWIDRRDFLALPPAEVSSVAIIASSAVFALAHNLWLAGFLAGLAYAQLYRRLGNLWCAVLAHATTNLALAIWVVAQRDWSYW
jgi:hypothetical protein